MCIGKQQPLYVGSSTNSFGTAGASIGYVPQATSAYVADEQRSQQRPNAGAHRQTRSSQGIQTRSRGHGAASKAARRQPYHHNPSRNVSASNQRLTTTVRIAINNDAYQRAQDNNYSHDGIPLIQNSNLQEWYSSEQQNLLVLPPETNQSLQQANRPSASLPSHQIYPAEGTPFGPVSSHWQTPSSSTAAGGSSARKNSIFGWPEDIKPGSSSRNSASERIKTERSQPSRPSLQHQAPFSHYMQQSVKQEPSATATG